MGNNVPRSQHTNKADARKTKQQLIDELRSVRSLLTAEQRRTSRARKEKETKETVPQIKFENLSKDYQLLTKTVETAGIAVISIDQDQNIIRFNQGAQIIFGYSSQEIIGAPLEMLLPSQVRAGHKTLVNEFKHSESDNRMMDRRGDISGQKKDGTIFPAKGAISHVTHEGVTTMTVFLQDISELKIANDRYEQTMGELAHVGRVNILGEMSASLAHELNQPLAAILANAQAMQHQTTLSEETMECVSDVIADTKRAGQVIRRLRSLSEHRKYHIENVDINLLIINTTELLRSQLIFSKLQVDSQLGSTVPMVPCDPIQLQQVFLNVLTNAIDATKELNQQDRRVLIRTRHLKSKTVEISFQDNGSGFTDKSYRSLLKPFFTTKEKGMGMGLAISNSILESVGGRLWATNNSGPGATFYITLPISTERVTVPTARKTSEPVPGDSTKGMVFIVDDDVAIRKSLGRLILAAGYEFETYSSAEEFRQREEYLGVGCIVVDLHMPGASGLDLQDEIKTGRNILPMIFITGGGDTASGVRAMKEGASDFLSKPVDEGRILECIEIATKKSCAMWAEKIRNTAAKEKVAKLTPRELEIMDLVVNGMRNKQIAFKLGISEKTVKVHRGHVMKKAEARTVSDLINVATDAAINS